MAERILLVDDEKEILELIAYLLKNEGMDVVTATTAADALKHINLGPFDLAILDIMLPDGQCH